MPRYVKQPNGYTCGPIAIINALKWAGETPTLAKDLEGFKKETHCNSETGTSHGDFDRVLRIRGGGGGKFKVIRRICPTLKDIDRHLDRPNSAVILNFWHKGCKCGESDPHYVFIIPHRSFDCFTAVNSFHVQKTVMSKLTRHELMKDLKRHVNKNDRYRIYPRAWFLTLTQS